MAILASAIITSLRGTLLDPSPGVTWDDARLLALLNEGERAIVAVKHEAYPVRAALTLAAGTKQALPAAGVALMEVYANTVSGRRVTITNRELQDAAATFFPAATQEVDVQHYMKDDRDPTRFDVVPPNDGTGSVEILYGAVPTAIASVGSNINVLDIYEQALKAFVLSQCYAENTERNDTAKSGYYATEFKNLLGISSQSQVAVSPKVGAQGGST
jgi:hypothetical protein